MKNINYILIALGLSMTVVSCKPEVKEEVKEDKTVNTPEKPSLERVTFVSDSMATVLKNDMPKVVKEHYNYAIARNIDVYSMYPKSDFAPKAIDLVQGYATQLGKHGMSVKWSEILLKEYPNYKNSELILFEMANDCNLMLNDTIKAKQYFTEFLEKYPESPFVEDAKFSLDHLGLTLEDIIKSAS